jgi:hypothetical protein
MTPIAPPVLITGLAFHAEPPPAEAGDYVPAVGTSREEKEILASLEDKAAAKTASDYQHIVWAYGILWALFAAYGLFLWRRSARLRADVDVLRQTLERTEAGGGPRG